ncbi:class I SAM-dependent DNA methyltransferase [Peptoniphilus catoniae]|uniref:class I SAM-dependent DNA methyltransferase n=1 Tax=Peptoniphilus catoniae TaxID=1660341 RepID=UPI0010FCE142|nr:class I SAM-dependent methyltransferase [Peptoniphilus catoniae]
MTYEKFAFIYDKLMSDYNYDKVYDFIIDFINEKSLKVKEILELGCGTGELTLRLANKYPVKALDLSSDMLSIADKKLIGLKADLYNIDMRDFKFAEKFDLALSVCDSLNYIMEEEDIESIFKNVYEHLNNKALFVFDLNTEERFKSFDDIYLEENEDVFLVWENFYDLDTCINTYSINFFVEKGDLYERFYEEHHERAYKKDFIIKALKDSGFKNIEIFSEYDKTITLEKSKRLVYIAEK